MIKGFEHLFTLGALAETVARNAYRADAFAVGGEQGLSNSAVKRALDGAADLESKAALLRRSRGEVTPHDAFAAMLRAEVGSIAVPGKWRIYRDGDKIVFEGSADGTS